LPLPAGVTTANVTFNTPISFAGGAGTAKLTIRPTQTIIHQASGTTIAPVSVTTTADGAPGVVAAPHVDQAGFVDSAGKAITNWAYKADALWTIGGESLVIKRTFQVLVGQSSVVFDLFPDTTASTPITAAVPAVLSVNGSTGAVTGLATVTQALLDAARDPEELFTGVITRDSNGAPTASSVLWPDGVTGTYAGTASATWPGAVDSYTITYGSPVTKTYTQPTVTRNSSGAITTRPTITVS